MLAGMAKLTQETIKNLAKLSRIHCTAEEERTLLDDLGKILHYIEQLNEVDTTDTAPCYQVLEGLVNVMRDDEANDQLPRETFLANAPDQIGGMIRVPPVIQQE